MDTHRHMFTQRHTCKGMWLMTALWMARPLFLGPEWILSLLRGPWAPITQQGYSVCLAHFAAFCYTGCLARSQVLLSSSARTMLVLGHPLVPPIMPTPTEGILQVPEEMAVWCSTSLEGPRVLSWLQNFSITSVLSETKLGLDNAY